MKHIKKYKVFESIHNDAIKDTIDDILIDIKDTGVYVNINIRDVMGGFLGRTWIKGAITEVSVQIWSDGDKDMIQDMKWGDLKDDILRVFDYLQGLEFKLRSYEFGVARYKYKKNQRYNSLKQYSSFEGVDLVKLDNVIDFFNTLGDNNIFVFNNEYCDVGFTFKKERDK